MIINWEKCVSILLLYFLKHISAVRIFLGCFSVVYSIYIHITGAKVFNQLFFSDGSYRCKYTFQKTETS